VPVLPKTAQAGGAESLYERDFVLWTKEQARLLRARNFGALDLENIAEELESMGNRDRRKVESHLTVIMAHLLKLRLQPEKRSRSWLRSVVNGRNRIALVVRDSPSLARQLPSLMADNHPAAVRLAAADTGLAPNRFPAEPPFEIDEVLNRAVEDL
jgi:hypothetical protein